MKGGMVNWGGAERAKGSRQVKQHTGSHGIIHECAPLETTTASNETPSISGARLADQMELLKGQR